MKITSHVKLFFLLLACFLATACQRSSNELIEDTKTAGHYVGKGFRAIGGKQVESRQIKNSNEFVGPTESDFIPLHEESSIRNLSMIDENSAIPQSKETPGEMGSTIPGIDGFFQPETHEEKSIFKNILFPTNKHAVQGRENELLVRQIASYLKENSSIYIFVEGHCDERGPQAYNLALGTRRANSVRNLLIKQGVDLDRIFTISYGKERPLALEHLPSAWSQNRRAEFKIFRR